MDYLSRQHNLVRRSLKFGIPIDDVLAIKFYIQKIMANSIAEKLNKKSRILEVGVGGSLAIHFLCHRGHECHGVDINTEFIEYSSMLKHELRSSVNLHLANAFQLPFSNEYFDYVYSVGVIEHYTHEKQLAFCKEMARVSRKYVHVEIPSYKKTSTFYSILKEESEPHYDCLLDELIKKSGLVKVEEDGRGMFNVLHILKQNKELHAYISANYPETIENRYRAQHIDKLVNAETSASKLERITYGFQVYAIGESIG